jgi:hypothetical protein
MLSLPIFDPNFVEPPHEYSNNTKDLVKEFKINCEYIKKNFKNYPSHELEDLISRNFGLLAAISNLDVCPGDLIFSELTL